MLEDAIAGVTAGALGTLALNVSTYADMAIRGRQSSGVPAQVAGKLAEGAGLDLAAGSGNEDEAKQKAQARKSGLGALMGYVVGLGIGAGYGLVRPRLDGLSAPLAAAVVGVAAMAASDVPAVSTGATDPRSWGVSGWLADLVPHLIYGAVTVVALEALRAGE